MSVCDVPVISAVCDTVGQGAATLIAAPFDWLAQAMGGAAAWLFEAVWAVFDTTTLVDVTDEGYVGVYNILFGVAVFVVLIFFCLQLITGLIHRDPTALTRAATGAAKSILGSFVAIGLTGLLLEITDQLAVGIAQATGNTMESIGDRITLLAAGFAGINIAAPGVGAIVTIFLAGLAISAAAIVWFSLLIRKALLLVAIVFAPIALAGFSWDATKGWFGKWATFVIALILSKLVLVVIFLVAITQVSAPIELDLASISDPIAGVVLMFIAAFAPYMTYKFVSFVGFDMYHSMSAEQEAKSALNRPVPVPSAPKADGAKKVLDGAGDKGGGAAPSGGGTSPASTAAPSAGGGSAASGGSGAAAGAGAGSAGGGAGAAGAGTGAGAAAAGPAAAVVIGAQVAKAAATAGPKLGGAVGGAAEGHAAGAGETVQPAPSPAPNHTPTAPPTSPSVPPAKQTPPPAPKQTTGKD
ncbi:conjugal transfer protein TrbL [Gulosibacter molinativorax]|uniref:Conjugal transfer protein TrbL n=2 Tax=Gulosibacter molinativorax TaxID=256821 RepID=A0ABT7CDV4_9MICO|nr:conjugal transfer protein TrbL [Gulosibacter molinativorax]MDJ1372794.1 conjugal transfer protein TrbL [Gulosibacter molinativorax]QUY61135.1 Conjugal transfer protein TrbL [Gulosibacter molinativorax]